MKSFRERLGATSDCSDRYLWGTKATVALSNLVGGSILSGRLPDILGRSVRLTTHDQLTPALALIEADGVERRLVVCSPDLPPEYLQSIVENAGIDAIVSDGDPAANKALDSRYLQINRRKNRIRTDDLHSHRMVAVVIRNDGPSKMICTISETLIAAIKIGWPPENPVIWGTFGEDS